MRESAIDSIATAIVLALAGYVMVTMVKYYRLSPKNILYVIGASLALAALCGGTLHELMKHLADDENYLKSLNIILPLRLVLIWLTVLTGALQGWLWFHVKEQRQQELHTKEAEQLLREAELASLRQQLQPHFLFNSLNSISSLTMVQPELARKMIEQLSDFLRGTVKKDGNQLVTLQDELHHLGLYLDIEKVRFGHRLITLINAEANTGSMKLPSLLLQPLVENAIKFGLYDTIGEVTIRIEAKSDNGMLLIQITNPFDPATASPKSGTGFGLQSVRRRLALLFYRHDLLSINKNENIFTTTIKIPQGEDRTP